MSLAVFCNSFKTYFDVLNGVSCAKKILQELMVKKVFAEIHKTDKGNIKLWVSMLLEKYITNIKRIHHIKDSQGTKPC